MTKRRRIQRFDLVRSPGSWAGQVVGVHPGGRYVSVLWCDGEMSWAYVGALTVIRTAEQAVSRHGRWTIRRVPVQLVRTDGPGLRWVWRWRVTAPHTTNGLPHANVYESYPRAVEMMGRWQRDMEPGA